MEAMSRVMCGKLAHYHCFPGKESRDLIDAGCGGSIKGSGGLRLVRRRKHRKYAEISGIQPGKRTETVTKRYPNTMGQKHWFMRYANACVYHD